MDVFQDAEQLQRVPMFARLDSSKLKLLAFTSEVAEFDDGQILFRVDEPSDSAYVIMDGKVDILAEDNGGEALFTLGHNQLVGEMGVISNAPRSATLRAQGHVRTLKITSDAFIKLISENPLIALDVMRQLSEKLHNTHRMLEHYRKELHELSEFGTRPTEH